MSVPVKKNPRVAFSWGILLSMLAVPILALMLKIFPKLEMEWNALLVVCALVITRCVIGYLFPGAGADAGDKKAAQGQH